MKSNKITIAQLADMNINELRKVAAANEVTSKGMSADMIRKAIKNKLGLKADAPKAAAPKKSAQPKEFTEEISAPEATTVAPVVAETPKAKVKPEISTKLLKELTEGCKFRYPTSKTEYRMAVNAEGTIKIVNTATNKEWNCSSEKEATKAVVPVAEEA